MTVMSERRTVRTACSLDCFDACGIVAHVQDGRIVRLGGALCNKVNHYHSQINHERQRDLASVRVHPHTARARGLADGDEVTLISSRGGCLDVRLTLDESTREDTVVALKGDWLKHGRGFNVLTEPRYTAGTGTAYNQNYVRLVPAGAV